MSYFWASVLQAFLPVALLLSAHWAKRSPYPFKKLFLWGCLALAAGVILGFYLPRYQKFILTFTIAQCAVYALFLLWQCTRWRELFWHVLLILLAAIGWGQTPALLSLSSVHVINTEFLLNVFSITVALFACFILGWLLYICIRHVGWLRWPVLLSGVALLVIPLSGQALLSLIKLGVLKTKPYLPYVAKTTNLSSEITYFVLVVVAVIGLAFAVFVVLKKRAVWKSIKELIASRIAKAQYIYVRDVFLGVTFITLTMLAGQLYWSLVASQPPALSDAKQVELADDDFVHLELTPLMDGNLHRFSWVADDGKVVRFFVINRLENRVAPAVVLDACLLCGDAGYVQVGTQVECVACGVYMFKPSIGKPGGCNPVPMEAWKVEDDVILIPRSALESGLMLFNTVLTIEVKDPVTGKALTNTKAPFRYTFARKTYFFENESSLEQFRADPDNYIQQGGQP